MSDEAIGLAARIGKLVQAYAMDENDNALFRQMQVNASMLDRMADTELPAALTDVLQRVQVLPSTPLKGYGVTEAMLSGLGDAIKAYEKAIGSPRVAISERKTHTDAIPGELKKMRQGFAKLDRLVVMFEEDAPGFVSDYRNARVIVDAGSRGSEEEKKG